MSRLHDYAFRLQPWHLFLAPDASERLPLKTFTTRADPCQGFLCRKDVGLGASKYALHPRMATDELIVTSNSRRAKPMAETFSLTISCRPNSLDLVA